MDTLQKKYVYKIYRDGTYLGELPNVISEFGYTQQLFTAGTELSIECGINVDTSSEQPEAILDENGSPILDEAGEILYEERASDVFGDESSLALIRNENDVEAYCYDQANPNGVKVFAGYISTWEADFGGSDNVYIKVLSYGAELDNYIITE